MIDATTGQMNESLSFDIAEGHYCY